MEKSTKLHFLTLPEVSRHCYLRVCSWDCPETDWANFGDKCYKYFAEKKNWEMARAECLNQKVRTEHHNLLSCVVLGWPGLHPLGRGEQVHARDQCWEGLAGRKERQGSGELSDLLPLVWRHGLGLPRLARGKPWQLLEQRRLCPRAPPQDRLEWQHLRLRDSIRLQERSEVFSRWLMVWWHCFQRLRSV